jgi:lipopolysaccharide export LptBFGC system permease protein LptF
MAHSLIAIAETAVDVGSGFSKFLDPVADASAEIEALIAVCFSTSAALRNLDEAIEEFEHERRYERIERIRRHVAIVQDSIVYTFQDVQRLFGVGLARATILPGLEYRRVWRNLTAHFGQESKNTLERRLEYYQEFIKALTCVLLEG